MLWKYTVYSLTSAERKNYLAFSFLNPSYLNRRELDAHNLNQVKLQPSLSGLARWQVGWKISTGDWCVYIRWDGAEQSGCTQTQAASQWQDYRRVTHTHRLWTPVDIHDTFWTDAFESPIGQVWHEAASLNNNKFLTRILGGEAFCAPINAIGLGVACYSPWGRKEWLNWTELNCGAGENSWESLGQQGDQTSKY